MKFVTYILIVIFTISSAFAEGCLDSLRIASWNTKHLGRSSFDYDSAIALLKPYDLIALQEINKNETGAAALKILREKLSHAGGEKWCSAISKVPTDSKERYAYLWRNSKVSIINDMATVVNDCLDQHYIVKLADKHENKIIREPSVAEFYAKQDKVFFKYASVHLVPTGKFPEKEVPFLFNSFDENKQLIIIGGDFNLSSSHPVFNQLKKSGWINALPDDTKTSLKIKDRVLNMAYDNFWYKEPRSSFNRCEHSFAVKNIYKIFPKLPNKHIYYKISDHTPVEMQHREKVRRAIASEVNK